MVQIIYYVGVFIPSFFLFYGRGVDGDGRRNVIKEADRGKKWQRNSQDDLINIS